MTLLLQAPALPKKVRKFARREGLDIKKDASVFMFLD
jgi:hypothetical protein